MTTEISHVAQSDELVFGIVAAVGTPIAYCTRIIQDELEDRQYECRLLRLSSFLSRMAFEDASPVDEGNPYDRIMALQTRGNRLRESEERGDILAMLAAGSINAERSQDEGGEPLPFDKTAWVLRQLKHPHEVFRLRRIYGDAFHLIGLYCPERLRQDHLVEEGMSTEDAQNLIGRDEYESKEWGQKFRDTFHLADVFIEVKGPTTAGDKTRQQLERYLDLLLGNEIVTPTRDEYGMFLASAGALRSAAMSRQVGAAILSEGAEVISIGCNEVPCWPGGLYWGDEEWSSVPDDARQQCGDEDGRLHVGDSRDCRDHIRGRASSDEMRYEIAQQIRKQLDIAGDEAQEEAEGTASVEEIIERLSSTRVMNLTEFTRAVHAEMEALTSAARQGVALRRCVLFTTTFPCHGCAKHIVAAGIRRVVFIEPYPKSLALEFHRDSIELETEEFSEKVHFQPFLGVAPRRYSDLFSITDPVGQRIRRKDDTGRPVKESLGLALSASRFSYLQLESMAAEEIIDRLPEEENDG